MLPSFLFIVSVTSILGANILVYSPPVGTSHIRLLGNIADILARAGHNVTVLSAPVDPLSITFGTTEKNINKILVKDTINPNVFQTVHESVSNIWDQKEIDPLTTEDCRVLINSLLSYHPKLLNDDDLINKLKNSKFDLAIFELYDISLNLFMEVIGIKKQFVVSAVSDIYPYTYELTGIPVLTSIVPIFLTVYDDKMNFYERANNIYLTRKWGSLLNEGETKANELYREYHPNIRSAKQLLLEKTGMFLENANEFTHTPRLSSSMIQLIGGSHIYAAKPVNEELEDILNRRKHNVFVSLGSFVQFCQAPNRIKLLFAEAFSSFPDVTFIVKYENCTNDEFNFIPYNNIVSRTWLPQTDLLGDERVNVFITHGGMNSITEGQYRGKPMLSIPILADQIINARNAVRVGSTIMLDRRFITKEELVTNLKMLLNAQSSYVKKAKFIQKSLEGREEEYRQKIVKWVELQAEAEKPFDHLILHSRNLSAIELYNLDILGAVIVIVLVILGTSLCLLKSLLSFLKPSTNKTKEQ